MKKLMGLLAVVLGLSFGGSQVVGAETIYLSGFDSYAGFTGEIRYQLGNTTDVGTFCVERNINVNVPGTYNFTLSALTGDQDHAAYLIEHFAPTPNGAYVGYTKLETSIALQLAVWKLDGNSPSDYYGFPTTGRIFDLYSTFLGFAVTGTPTGDWAYADLRALNGSDVQDILVNRAVPEPATMLLFGLGLLGLAGVRRKLKK